MRSTDKPKEELDTKYILNYIHLTPLDFYFFYFSCTQYTFTFNRDDTDYTHLIHYDVMDFHWAVLEIKTSHYRLETFDLLIFLIFSMFTDSSSPRVSTSMGWWSMLEHRAHSSAMIYSIKIHFRTFRYFEGSIMCRISAFQCNCIILLTCWCQISTPNKCETSFGFTNITDRSQKRSIHIAKTLNHKEVFFVYFSPKIWTKNSNSLDCWGTRCLTDDKISIDIQIFTCNANTPTASSKRRCTFYPPLGAYRFHWLSHWQCAPKPDMDWFSVSTFNSVLFFMIRN